MGTRLGVETCFATPDWDVDHRWQLGRQMGHQCRLDDGQTPLARISSTSASLLLRPGWCVGVPADSTLTSVEDLAGQSVCVATATTYWIWVEWRSQPQCLPDIYCSRLLPTSQLFNCQPIRNARKQLRQAEKTFVAYVTSKTVVDANIAAGMASRNNLGGRSISRKWMRLPLTKPLRLTQRTLAPKPLTTSSQKCTQTARLSRSFPINGLALDLTQISYNKTNLDESMEAERPLPCFSLSFAKANIMKSDFTTDADPGTDYRRLNCFMRRNNGKCANSARMSVSHGDSVASMLYLVQWAKFSMGSNRQLGF